MIIQEMHYDFKSKFNKLDSQQNRNLLVPEIDWKINEAIQVFVKIVAEPKYATRLGFEISQRTIDDISPLVVNDRILVEGTGGTSKAAVYALPEEYQHFISFEEIKIANAQGCSVSAEKVFVRQHHEDFQASTFDKSSFLWREVNVKFFSGGLKVYTSEEFTVEEVKLNYIKAPLMVNNSESFIGGTYTTLGGQVLTQNVNCNLPAHVHPEIVDIAVAIASGDLVTSDYQIKKDKLNMNQLT